MTASLYVTVAPNDNDLARALGSLAIRIPIPHGDVVFWGVDEDPSGAEVPIRVCCERKKIRDMVACIVSGRYLHQSRSAHEAGFERLVLIVEGEFRSGPETGQVEVPVTHSIMDAKSLRPRVRRFWESVAPPLPYPRFDQYLSELALYTGILVKRSKDVRETAAQVKAIWQLFQKLPSEHQSLKMFYTAPHPASILSKPGLVRRVANELDDIGWARSAEIAKRFQSVKEMVDATEEDWEAIPGIGTTIARKAVSALTGSSPK
jgi:ERCC4-type nuclease